MKYEGENEDDLKDKQDFVKADPDHYPPGRMLRVSLIYWHHADLKQNLGLLVFQVKSESNIRSHQYVLFLVERPNLGCRTLVYRNFSRIISGIHNDIVDWVVNTRVKSAQLLYTLMINEEDNATQHLEKVLNCLQRAAADDEKQVIEYVSAWT